MDNYNNNDNQLRSTRTIAFEGWGNLFFAVVGLVFFLLGIGKLKFDGLPCEVILNPVFVTLGVTFLSNSIYNFIRFIIVSPDENILYRKAVTLFNHLKLQKDYGLVNIFKKNTEAANAIVSEIINIYQKPMGHEKYSCDIICNGTISGFMEDISSHQDEIINYLKQGFCVRMIISNPKLNFLSQLHIDSTFSLDIEAKTSILSSAYSSIKNEFDSLLGTVNLIMSHPDIIKNKVGRIDIKFTNNIPALQYHRIGDKVFVSSRMIGKEYAIEPVVNEYEKTNNENDAFHMYKEFFERYWNNKNFSWYDKKLYPHSDEDLSIELNPINPRLVIGDVIIDRVMRMTCNALVMILRTVNPSSIGHKS